MISTESARRKVLTALLAGFLFSPAACKSRAPAAPPAPPPAAKRQAAPGFTLTDLKGRKVSLADFKGKKAVFLEFWATWCGPCRMSMPEVEKLHEEYAAKGLQVLGVSVDEDPAPVSPFVQEMGVRYPILMAGRSGVDVLYQVSGIPAFFLIDKEGNVADGWVGFDPAFGPQWRRVADQIIAQ